MYLLYNTQAIPVCLARELLHTAFSPAGKRCLDLIAEKFSKSPKAASVPTCQHLSLLKKIWHRL